MPEEVLLVDTKDYICTLILNRPQKHNALTPRILQQLRETLISFKEDKGIRVVIIRGAGDKAFSAGFDISLLGGQSEGEEDYLQEALKSIRDCPVPVIAMINGFALGGGCEIAVNCDLRIAGDNARFGMPQAKLGMMESYQAIQRFINIVGVTHTKEIFFTGRMIEAPYAKEMGLVNQVVSGKDLGEVCYNLAQEIAANAPLSVKGSKAIIEKCLGCQALTPQVEKEIQEIVTDIFRSQDCKEGMSAFMEKRKPRFTGK
jgi:enoyl-CoA hydratase/carnithine racemase